MNRQILYRNAARRALKEMDHDTRARIVAALETYGSTERGDVARLHGVSPPAYRLRVGKWRVTFSHPQYGVMLVESIDNRGEAYRNTR